MPIYSRDFTIPATLGADADFDWEAEVLMPIYLGG